MRVAQIEHSLRAELESFPMMASAVQEQTQNFMQDCLRPAEQMIRSLVDCHLSYINMSHPQFVGATEALRIADQWVQQSNQPPPSAENGGVLDSHKLAPEHAGHGAATHAPSRYNALRRTLVEWGGAWFGAGTGHSVHEYPGIIWEIELDGFVEGERANTVCAVSA